MPRLDALGHHGINMFSLLFCYADEVACYTIKDEVGRRYSVPMSKGRLEAFSDGVFAVIITIMVLELKAPHSGDLEAFVPLLPGFLTYVLSYVFLGIYWNNHHHLMHAIDRVNGASLWANLHLLFRL